MPSPTKVPQQSEINRNRIESWHTQGGESTWHFMADDSTQATSSCRCLSQVWPTFTSLCTPTFRATRQRVTVLLLLSIVTRHHQDFSVV